MQVYRTLHEAEPRYRINAEAELADQGFAFYHYRDLISLRR